MLFNSIEFIIFLPIVFVLYWFVFNGKLNIQNALVLVASYVFYGWWDWRFLSLIVFSSFVDFTIGKSIYKAKSQKIKKRLLYLSLIVNLGFLGYFKYFNFFIESFIESFELIGVKLDWTTLNIILPIGISYYTFQTLSYTIDVYRGDMKPAKDPIAFFAFVSFFPQLVAGPIERAVDLYPQFLKKRKFSYPLAVDGLRQTLVGLFKKMVIADRLAPYVSEIYEAHESLSGMTVMLGAMYFSFQIYADFSGYSDVAIGVAKIFGFDLKQNFNIPYISKNMTEFWRRWHISLSTWIRDYLYMPLVIHFRNLEKTGMILAFIIAFSINGLWHGASWNFVVWGIIHGFILSYELQTKKIRKKIRKKTNKNIYNWVSIVLTFFVWFLTLILFRATDLTHAFDIIKSIFSNKMFSLDFIKFVKPMALVVPFMVIEYFQQNKTHILQIDDVIKYKYARWVVYYLVIFAILYLAGKQQEFIYFQF